MAFIESIENQQLAVDSFDQIFFSSVKLPLMVRKVEGLSVVELVRRGKARARGGGGSRIVVEGSMCFSDITVKQPPIVGALILRLHGIVAP